MCAPLSDLSTRSTSFRAASGIAATAGNASSAATAKPSRMSAWLAVTATHAHTEGGRPAVAVDGSRRLCRCAMVGHRDGAHQVGTSADGSGREPTPGPSLAASLDWHGLDQADLALPGDITEREGREPPWERQAASARISGTPWCWMFHVKHASAHLPARKKGTRPRRSASRTTIPFAAPQIAAATTARHAARCTPRGRRAGQTAGRQLTGGRGMQETRGRCGRAGAQDGQATGE